MASDHMHGLSATHLLRWVLADLQQGSAFGVLKEQFFTPRKDDPFRTTRYGKVLETPLGVAAGPHTQMAQNLVVAWLTGSRYLELKTVQILDQIVVTKPCIDLEDEGYNCEWSQELTLDKSYEEYLKAWVLIHILHDHLGFEGTPGLIFNMSAGYSLEGIGSPTVQRFLDRMCDCADDVARLKKELEPLYPRVTQLNIPGSMSDSLTISCMHGCPPPEVEGIALHFIEKRKLNTTLKMNPTLLGSKCVRGILNKTLGFETVVPDLAFEHDLPYEDALRIIRNCRDAADRLGLHFAVKLTNTLETDNTHQNLPKNEKMVYMSGRPLHPIAIALASRLQRDFSGDLDMSFCAGVDALNVVDTLACGLSPVTVCSDYLKPGGYARGTQYLAELRKAMQQAGANDIDTFILKKAGAKDRKSAVMKNLDEYAAIVTAEGSRYCKAKSGTPSVKTERPLPALDCAAAPCMSACPANQHIPAYIGRAALGDMQGALSVIMTTNPFPSTLGKMCNQACRTKCMRQHYDASLKIRDIKLCSAECGANRPQKPVTMNGLSTAIIGAGPAGLSCAYYLALAGCSVVVFEATDEAGGKVLKKMKKEAARISTDINAILALGVELHTGETVDKERLALLAPQYDAIYVATGKGDVLQCADTGTLSAGKPIAGKYVYQDFSTAGSSPSLVESVGEGKRAATVVLSALGLDRLGEPRFASPDVKTLRKRQTVRTFGPEKLEPGNTESIKEEASRCLHCDHYCGICVSVCPNRANMLLQAKINAWPLQEAYRTADGVRIVTVAKKTMKQSWQIVNIGDFCNECGNCAAFCPSSGAPYRDKWRMHLSDSSFNADSNGFIWRSQHLLEGKQNGRAWTLKLEENGFVYDDETVHATLDRNSFAARNVELKTGCDFVSLNTASEAAVFCHLTAGNPAVPVFANN